jgi:hypothetical protein
MALRAGYKGADLRPDCEREGVAVLTYKGIHNVDLSKYTEGKKPSRWELKGSAPGSMVNFAWRVRGGDLIYVRDSMQNNTMVAFGEVQGTQGELAYRFDPNSTIRVGNTIWRHKIPVKWSKTFKPFQYKDRSANISVLKLNPEEIADFSTVPASRDLGGGNREPKPNRPSRILDDVYHRYNRP